RASGGDILRRKHLEEEAEVRPVACWVGAEVPRGPDGDRELRKHVTAARDRECLARQGALACQQRRDRLANPRCVRIGHEESQVVPKISKRLLTLEGGQGVGE